MRKTFDESKEISGADAAAVVSAGSIDRDAAPHAAPTLDEMKSAIAKFGDAVDKEEMTLAAIYGAVCTDKLEKLVMALESGDYALISTRARNAHEASAIRLLKIETGNQASSEVLGSVPSAAQETSSTNSKRSR